MSDQELNHNEEIDEEIEPTPRAKPDYGFPIFIAVVILGFAIFFGVRAYSEEPSTIQLSGAETKQAQGIAEQRQSLAFDRAKVQNDYQAEMNRIAEREATLNVEAEKLCFALKRAHAIAPTKQYWLDEWRGVLKKQGN